MTQQEEIIKLMQEVWDGGFSKRLDGIAEQPVSKEPVKFRFHRGILQDSLKTVKEVKSRMDLAALIAAELHPLGFIVNENTLSIDAYYYDDRINWDTYIVTLDGLGVIGFLDGPL